jgi:hypothetical protein
MVATIVFTGGAVGPWVITSADAQGGEPLAEATRVSITVAAPGANAPVGAWALRGFVSNLRYATRAEAEVLRLVQPPLNRQAATRAALIPIRKSAAWWDLAQDERRAIFEETSHHTSIGRGYLPAVARRLHHCRDLGEPFDFLTWFEFAPEHESAFDALVAALRATHEWSFVEREVDIRLTRDAPG